MFQGIAVNDHDLPENGANSTELAPAPDATSAVATDEQMLTQDEELVAVVEGDVETDTIMNEEDLSAADDDDDMAEEFDESLEDEAKSAMEEFFSEDSLFEEMSELDVLTLEEAAVYLKVEYGAIRRLLKEQGLPGRKIGEEWRFLRGALADWLRAPGGAPVPAVQPERVERPKREERPREDRPRFEERFQKEERPRRRYSEENVGGGEGYPQQSRPPRKRPPFRSEGPFDGGYQGGPRQGGPGQGGYPPPRRRRYEDEQLQQQFPQGEYRPPRKRPFRSEEGEGMESGQQFGGGFQGGGRRFAGGPKKPKRQALNTQRFKRLDRRQFGEDQGGNEE